MGDHDPVGVYRVVSRAVSECKIGASKDIGTQSVGRALQDAGVLSLLHIHYIEPTDLEVLNLISRVESRRLRDVMQKHSRRPRCDVW